MKTKMMVMDLDLLSEVRRYGRVLQDKQDIYITAFIAGNTRETNLGSRIYEYDGHYYTEIRTNGDLRAFFKIDSIDNRFE